MLLNLNTYQKVKQLASYNQTELMQYRFNNLNYHLLTEINDGQFDVTALNSEMLEWLASLFDTLHKDEELAELSGQLSQTNNNGHYLEKNLDDPAWLRYVESIWEQLHIIEAPAHISQGTIVGQDEARFKVQLKGDSRLSYQFGETTSTIVGRVATKLDQVPHYAWARFKYNGVGELELVSVPQMDMAKWLRLISQLNSKNMLNLAVYKNATDYVKQNAAPGNKGWNAAETKLATIQANYQVDGDYPFVVYTIAGTTTYVSVAEDPATYLKLK